MDGTFREAAEPDHTRIHGFVQRELEYLGKDETLHPRQEPSRAERGISDGAGEPRVTTENSSVADLQQDLCGLALSGGGLRSATFNLGLLQAFHQMGLLRVFDYVATVSGGGYIGGFWSAWRSRHARPFPEDKEGSRGADLPEVRHLRAFSHFLVPRLGLFSIDTSRMLASLLMALIPSLLVTLSFIVLVLGAWTGLAWCLLTGPDPGTVRWEIFQEPYLSWSVIALVTLVTLGLGTSPKRFRWGGTVALLATLLTVVGWYLWLESKAPSPDEVHLDIWRLSAHMRPVSSPFGKSTWSLPDFRTGYFLFWPCLAWLGSAGVLVLLRWLSSRWRLEAVTATVGRVTSLLLLLAGGWALFAALFLLSSRNVEELTASAWWLFTVVVPGLVAVLARLQQLAGRQPSKPVEPGRRSRLKRLVPQLVAYVTLGLMVMGAASLLIQAVRGGALEWVLGPALVITGLSLVLFDANNTGLHAFYRSRIARAYLGAAHGHQDFETEQQPEDDRLLDAVQPLMDQKAKPVLDQLEQQLDARTPQVTAMQRLLDELKSRLGALESRAGVPESSRRGVASTLYDLKSRLDERGPALDTLEPRLGELKHQLRAPLHLICCAANDLSSDPLANFYRGARSAVLSPLGFSVGSQWVSWSEVARADVPTLASAVTASGAALNSHMGSRSMQLGPAVTFLMTAFNLRLGMWWPHPSKLRTRASEKRKRRRLAGLPFYKELLGRSRVQEGKDVLLSDGGHFENLAIYELVRRHCRYIVVSDCGMDTQTAFDDFANAVRRVREDFGVEIRIDLSPLRPGDGELAQQPMVAGDIEYPSGDMGVLLLIKPTLVGQEPPDITQYKQRNRDFPHETTGDQSYDEAQWESYRRLGEHIARSAFQPVLEERGRVSDTKDGIRTFAHARYEWLPSLPGYAQRFSDYAQRSSELDKVVCESHQKLFTEVFEELAALKPREEGSPRPASRFRSRRGDGAAGLDLHDLVASLHLVRRASLLMQEVFISEDLAHHHSHPAYLGVMNYFGRWTNSPFFRMWWPLLRGLYPLRFTRFLESRFELSKTLMGKEQLHLRADEHGYAMRTWVHTHPGWSRGADQQVISYERTLTYREQPYLAQFALLHARRDVVRTEDGEDKHLLRWSSQDFYVPPGLWGINIGEQFLTTLVSERTDVRDDALQQLLDGVSALVVEMRVNRTDSPDQRKVLADTMQLYRSCGFTQPTADLLRALKEHPRDAGSRQSPRPEEDDRWLTRWLVRELPRPARQQVITSDGETRPLWLREETVITTH